MRKLKLEVGDDKDIPKGGGGEDGQGVRASWRLWGYRGPQARGAMARGSPLLLRPKNGF